MYTHMYISLSLYIYIYIYIYTHIANHNTLFLLRVGWAQGPVADGLPAEYEVVTPARPWRLQGICIYIYI